MSFNLLVVDRFCKGRYIGYLKHAVQVFYKHELRSLADLFACVGGDMAPHLSLSDELQSLSDILCLEKLNLPPPNLNDMFDNKQAFHLAGSIALMTVVITGLYSSAEALPTGYQSV